MKLTERAELRRRAGLTQHQLSKLTGISAPRISLWENDEIELPSAEIVKIAHVLQDEMWRSPFFRSASEASIDAFVDALVGEWEQQVEREHRKESRLCRR